MIQENAFPHNNQEVCVCRFPQELSRVLPRQHHERINHSLVNRCSIRSSCEQELVPLDGSYNSKNTNKNYSMKDYWDSLLEFCHQTTKVVGDRLLQDFGNIQAVKKADGSLVTKADQWADGAIREAIAKAFPEHGVLTEETTHIFPANDWCWIIDPIDGTTNFTRGVPIWGISLGLLYRGTPVFGFVYIPCLQQAFYGYLPGSSGLEMPIGAYMNGNSIKTTSDIPSKSHLFNFCARSLAILKKPFPCKVRMIGVASYNLLLVAAGAVIGGVEATPKIWDIAAVWVIVQAAGGAFIHLDEQDPFPLTINKDYGQASFPTLALAREELIITFKPLASVILERNTK